MGILLSVVLSAGVRKTCAFVVQGVAKNHIRIIKNFFSLVARLRYGRAT